MARYEFICDECGAQQELVQGMHDKHPEFIPCICGQMARRDWQAEQGCAHNRKGKELYCEHNPYDAGPGAEVHPDQVAAEQSYIKEHRFQGVSCVPTEDGMAGRIVATSKRGWKAYAESRGYFNKDGGHGDPQQGVQRRPSGPETITIGEES